MWCVSCDNVAVLLNRMHVRRRSQSPRLGGTSTLWPSLASGQCCEIMLVDCVCCRTLCSARGGPLGGYLSSDTAHIA